MVLATCGFSVSIEVKVPTFHRTASWQAQATSHAGCHSARKQVSSELVPQQFTLRGFGLHLTILDTSTVVPFRSSSCQSPDPILAGPFPYALTTMAFDHSRQRRFEINSCKPVSRGLPHQFGSYALEGLAAPSARGTHKSSCRKLTFPKLRKSGSLCDFGWNCRFD